MQFTKIAVFLIELRSFPDMQVGLRLTENEKSFSRAERQGLWF